MRGAGKTTVGRELANLLKLPFVDTDSEIERHTGRTIADIFAIDGEAAFRRLEVDAVRDAVAQTPCVISVGGGAVLDVGNVDRLKRTAVVVWLFAPVEVLCNRVSRDAASPRTRPSLTEHGGLDELRTLLARREPLYRAAADVMFDTGTSTPGVIARALQMQLADFARGGLDA